MNDLTVGTVTFDGSTSVWPYDGLYNTTPSYYIYAQQPPAEPDNCIGRAHVFACDHEPKCKCGAITRVMPRAKRSK